ncbi:uncharacterized protein LOC144432524 isoform X2 [Glandiceps talaboti]
MVWMNTLAVLLLAISTTSFPLSNYGKETQDVLEDLFGENFDNKNYEPVRLTQRDQERLEYEDWPRKDEKLSRHKYKFDNEDMYGTKYDLLGDPEYLREVYKELFTLVYPVIYQEYLNIFLSELRKNQEENQNANDLAPLKRAADDNDFWRYYVTQEDDLPGLRRRNSFELSDQYLLNEGLPLRQRSSTRENGDWGDQHLGARIDRAFAKSSGVSDKDVLNKKAGDTDTNFDHFDWENFQNLAKRFPSKFGYHTENAGIPPFIPYRWEGETLNRDPGFEVYRRDGQKDGYFPGDEDLSMRDTYLTTLLNRRAEPILDLVGPYAGYNMYGKLLSEGKRTRHDDIDPYFVQNPNFPFSDDETPFNEDISLDDISVDEDDSYDEILENDSSIMSDESESEEEEEEDEEEEAEEEADLWDPLLKKIDDLPDIPEQMKEIQEDEKEGVDLDNDLDGVWVPPEVAAALEEEIDENEGMPEVETERMDIKAHLRQQIIELLQKIGTLRRR